MATIQDANNVICLNRIEELTRIPNNNVRALEIDEFDWADEPGLGDENLNFDLQ